MTKIASIGLLLTKTLSSLLVRGYPAADVTAWCTYRPRSHSNYQKLGMYRVFQKMAQSLRHLIFATTRRSHAVFKKCLVKNCLCRGYN